MNGLVAAIRLRLRSGRVSLLAAPAAIAGLVAVTAVSIAGLYGTAEARAGYAASIGDSAAGAAFNGRGYDLDTAGGITALEVGLFGQLLVAACGIGLAIRHTRREEESGLTELITATRIAPLAPLASAAVVIGGACTAAGVLSALATGSAGYGAGIGLLMAAYAGVGLVAGQLAQTARTAWALALGFLLATLLVRATVDGRGLDATWLSPLGWPAEIRPFGAAPQLWPLVALAAMTTLTTAGAVAIARRRDLGAGVVAPRLGPPRARPGLASPLGLAARLAAGTLVGWAAFAAVWAAVFGALSHEVTRLIDANSALLEAMGVRSATDLVSSLALLFIALSAGAAGLGTVGTLSAEEAEGRLGLVAATRVPLRTWWPSWGAVALAGAGAVLLGGAAVLGVATALATGRGAEVGSALAAGAGYLIPVAVIVLVGLASRAATVRPVLLGWVALAWAGVVGLLAETLRLPGWARDLSPLHAVGTLPIDAPDLTATVVLGALAVVLGAATPALAARRDLAAG
ncbi:hypothetical protein ACLQ3K_09040 [Tsukamurella sp. DT100]|uniref:hypothetical protein n=1 Tax=Tsukamurella sp. DT100 TaxID=3393415 RepID=UPI003CEB55BB